MNLTEWKNNELIPRIYDSIDTILPEFNFKKTYKGWISPFKLDLSEPKKARADKTIITEEYPSRMLEQGGDSINIIDYLMNKRNKPFIELCRELATELSLKMHTGDYSPQDVKKIEFKRQILEKAQELFKSNLVNEVNIESKAYLDYLVNNRGYSKGQIEKMNLGFITDQKSTIEALLLNVKGDTAGLEEEIKDVLYFKNSKIGDSHKLSIPFIAGGVIRGFKYRTKEKDIKPTYLNTQGLSKNILFNISAFKLTDIIIMEGELDALSSTYHGIDNVVALTGSSLNKDNIEDLKRRGVRTVTLCLDSEVKDKDIVDKTLKMINLLLENKLTPFVVELPTGDPDSIIKTYDADKLKQFIKEAIPFYEYWIKYKYVFEDKLKPKEAHNIIEDIIDFSSTIKVATEKDKFYNFLEDNTYLQQLGISKDSVKERVKEIAYNKQEQESLKKADKLLKDSQELIKQGKPSEALESLKTGINKIQIKSNEERFSELLKPITEEQIKEEFKTRAGDLVTSFIIEGEPLTFPAGQLSYLVAPTNHGKSSFLSSIALDIVDKKKVYLLGYEESRVDRIANILSAYCNEEYSSHNKETIKSYYRQGTSEFFREGFDSFKTKKQRFYKELIETQRLNIIDPNMDSTQLTNFIKYIAEKEKEAVILIDYIQLISLPPNDKKRFNSRQEELKEICLRLLDAAKETGLPIILNAQFNREVDNPLKLHLKHISEAGDIERQASEVIGLFFLEKKMNYKDNEESRIKKLLNIESTLENLTGLYAEVLKSRRIKTGASNVFNFNGNIGRVSNKTHHKEKTDNDYLIIK